MTENSNANTSSMSKEGKYLTFQLGEEEYGLEILKVMELMYIIPITKVPRTPHFVRGVVNLRGNIIPVTDLRLKLNMPGIEDTEKTCIIVVGLSNNDKNFSMGILVDSVSEVLDIESKNIEPAPSFGTTVDTQYILGLAKIKDSLKILLNIEKIITAEDVNSISDQITEDGQSQPSE